MEIILSVDLGTSAIKTALFDSKGNLLASSNQEYNLLTPTNLSVEMQVETYWNSFKNSVRDIISKSNIKKDEVSVIGISAQGETLILLDKSYQPLRNAIVWMDSRAQKESEELSKIFVNEDVYGITGQVSIAPTWPASKIYWVKKNEPSIFEKVSKYLLIEDYFIHRLTGEFAAEGSLLCSTLYWDIHSKKYWGKMLNTLEISEEQLPPIYESGIVVGNILPSIADEIGLSIKTKVCTGVLDQVAGAIGVGNVKTGIFSECTGSALAVVATMNKAFKDPGKRMPCHYHGMPNTYMAHTFTTGGMVMKWYKDNFCKCEKAIAEDIAKDPYSIMTEGAESVTPGADGLIMLPHLQGAMAPENNPQARGVFYGITLAHKKPHFVRSIMEGISFILKRNLDVVEELGISPTEIRSIGGGAKSKLWSQIKADITGKPIIVTKTDEEACLGAAIVAGVGVGIFKDLKEASTSMVEKQDEFEPNHKASKKYSSIYERYKNLYDNLVPIFKQENKI